MDWIGPLPPYNSGILRQPVSRRTELQRKLSQIASSTPTLNAATTSTALKAVARNTGTIVFAWRKTSTPREIRAWVPGGTQVVWGDATADATPVSDGFVTHTYAAPGTYDVNLGHSAWEASGMARVVV